MTDLTTKAQLLDSIQHTHGDLVTLLAGLREADMQRPGAMGNWTVKDILVHITGWEQHLLRWYRAGQRGEEIAPPRPGFFTDEIVDQINQALYDAGRHLPLVEVRAAFDTSYGEILAAVEAMSEEEIFTVGRWAWTREHALLSYIRANTDEHYSEHLDAIRAWLAAK